MRPSVALQAHRQKVRDIVSAHGAINPRVFGAVARGDDTSESHFDLLIDPTAETTLLDVGTIRQELLILLGVTVEVLTPKALPTRFRDSVLAEAVPV
ncbi:MAG: nucleotidyltransferase [Actinobacteria bacterium]|nr:nucleotidyltransferase [Actinomycetota bacterium]